MGAVDILNLPGWQVTGCQEDEDHYVLFAEPSSCASVCPKCGSASIVKHARDQQILRDLPCHGKQVIICVNRLRHRCKRCLRTWVEPLPGVDERRSATARLVRYVARQSLTRTFVAVAAECGIDEKTVRNIFHDFVAELERTVQLTTPGVMGMDELHLMGQPRGMMTDLQARTVIEVLPDRRKQSIIKYLTALPNKDQVQVCVIDMWRPYLEAIEEALPHVTVVIDKFHVIKQLNAVVEAVRKEIRSGLSERQKRQLMHDRFLLLKRPQDLKEPDRLILEAWLGTFPRLKAVYERKEEFYAVYEAATEEEAWTRYLAWHDRVAVSGVYDAFLEFFLTVEAWGEFIFNYFRFRYTGGFVEAANGIGRVIDRQGRGYSFEVLRARLLYGQSFRRLKGKQAHPPDDLHRFVGVDASPADIRPSTSVPTGLPSDEQLPTTPNSE